jgi:hypothetical protein
MPIMKHEELSMERPKVAMRELVCEVGGGVRAGENRKGWIARVARVAGITPRSVRTAFRGEPMSEVFRAGVEAKLRAAKERLEATTRKQEQAARDELAELQERLARIERHLLATDPDFFQPDAGGHRELLRVAGREGHADQKVASTDGVRHVSTSVNRPGN